MTSSGTGITGDELAMLLDRHRERLLARARRRHPRVPAADLEDCYGDTVVAILGRGGIESEQHLLGAMTLGIDFRVLHWARRQGRVADAGDTLDTLIDPRAAVDAVAADRDEARLLTELLAELEPPEQAVLRLRAGEGFSRARTAKLLELDVPELRRLERGAWQKVTRVALLAQAGGLCHRRGEQIALLAAGGDDEAARAHLKRCRPCRRAFNAQRRELHRKAAAILPLPLFGARAALLGAGGGATAGSTTSGSTAGASGFGGLAAQAGLVLTVIAATTVAGVMASSGANPTTYVDQPPPAGAQLHDRPADVAQRPATARTASRRTARTPSAPATASATTHERTRTDTTPTTTASRPRATAPTAAPTTTPTTGTRTSTTEPPTTTTRPATSIPATQAPDPGLHVTADLGDTPVHADVPLPTPPIVVTVDLGGH